MHSAACIENMSEKEIIAAVISSSNDKSYTDLNNEYIINSMKTDVSLLNGVFETPDLVINYMIELAIEKNIANQNNLKWYDPCSGSGKFPVKILEKLIGSLVNIKSENELPVITFSELSKFGFYVSLLNINIILKENNLSLAKYIKSGRLTPILCDSLEINSESLDMFSNIKVNANIVIGNPPYVRSTRLSKEYKEKLKHLYPSSYNGSEDLYPYFYANAINCLGKDGVVCFISPSSFFKKTTSKPIRRYLLERVRLERIVDLDENKIFNNVSLHTIICCLKKSKQNIPVEYYHATSDKQVGLVLENKVKYDTLPSTNFGMNAWSLESHNIDIAATKKLKESGFIVRSGIRSGIKKAFIYERDDLQNLPGGLVKNAINAKSIKKWKTENYSNKLLFITNKNKQLHKQAIPLLEPYKDKLKARSEVKTDKNWMLLRACSYYDDMNMPKIIFPDITKEPKFSIDTSCSFILDGAFFINSSDKSLLGILNSTIAWNYFKATCPSIGNVANKGRLRLKKSHIEDFPLPLMYEQCIDIKNQIKEVVEEILLNGENEELLTLLNYWVSEIYKVND